MKGLTKVDAAHQWVEQFNAIPYGVVEKLMKLNCEDVHEITPPASGDRVYVYDLPDDCDTLEQGGRIIESVTDEEDRTVYRIELDDGTVIENIDESEFNVERDNSLPMWGWMWSFGDRADDYWLEELGGLQKMADCGFRIYEQEDFGYIFGIDGCGYTFMEAHWLPLYNARGLQWHDPAAEQKRVMERNGYEIKNLGTERYWFDGDRLVEEVLEDR